MAQISEKKGSDKSCSNAFSHFLMIIVLRQFKKWDSLRILRKSCINLIVKAIDIFGVLFEVALEWELLNTFIGCIAD